MACASPHARGFTLVELLVALTLVLVVSAGLSWVAADAQRHLAVQPELAELSQRVRVAAQALERDIRLAGSGTYRGTHAGPLPRVVPAIFPDRRVATGGGGALFEGDAITLLRVADNAAQAMVVGDMHAPDDIVPIGAVPSAELQCPPGEPACGFRDGMRAIAFDRLGAFDLIAITQAGPAGLAHQPVQLVHAYRETDEAHVAEVEAVTYYFDAERHQLRRSYGAHTDAPVIDQVVGLTFDYYGDIFPPEGPRPPAGQANCLYDEVGNARLAGLAATDGTLVKLTAQQLTDGPYCGDGAQRYDADLYRIRRVRVRLRVQVGLDTLRGRDPQRFQNPGTSTDPASQIADLAIQFDVSPRNVQLR